MADQKQRLAGLCSFFASEIGQLLNQMRPVAGDRVGWIVSEFFDGLHVESALPQAAKKHAVG